MSSSLTEHLALELALRMAFCVLNLVCTSCALDLSFGLLLFLSLLLSFSVLLFLSSSASGSDSTATLIARRAFFASAMASRGFKKM